MGGHIGYTYRQRLNSVILYDKTTVETSHLPSMNLKRVDFGAVLVDNKIYAVGGTRSGFSRDQIEALDMDHLAGGWQTINVQLPAEYRYHLGFCNAAAIGSTIYILVTCE